MATSVKITTPIPTVDQTARALGISGERKKRLIRLADDAVESYYRREASEKIARRAEAKKAKAA